MARLQNTIWTVPIEAVGYKKVTEAQRRSAYIDFRRVAEEIGIDVQTVERVLTAKQDISDVPVGEIATIAKYLGKHVEEVIYETV